MKNPPGGLPKRMSENRSQNNIENIGKMWILASNLAPLGRPWGTLGHPWGVPGAPLGAIMAPRPLPRGPGTPPDHNFSRFSSIFRGFLSVF